MDTEFSQNVLEAPTTNNDELQCPKCKKAKLYERVPRATWVKTLFFFLPIKRFKCHHCGKRSYILF